MLYLKIQLSKLRNTVLLSWLHMLPMLVRSTNPDRKERVLSSGFSPHVGLVPHWFVPAMQVALAPVLRELRDTKVSLLKVNALTYPLAPS
jgi:hypothetical protein